MKTMDTISPLKSIRRKCLDCCSNKRSLVRKCEAVECSLYSYRFGHNPKRKGMSRFKTPQDRVALVRNPNSTASSDGNAQNRDTSMASVKATLTTACNAELEVH